MRPPSVDLPHKDACREAPVSAVPSAQPSGAAQPIAYVERTVRARFHAFPRVVRGARVESRAASDEPRGAPNWGLAALEPSHPRSADRAATMQRPFGTHPAAPPIDSRLGPRDNGRPNVRWWSVASARSADEQGIRCKSGTVPAAVTERQRLARLSCHCRPCDEKAGRARLRSQKTCQRQAGGPPRGKEAAEPRRPDRWVPPLLCPCLDAYSVR